MQRIALDTDVRPLSEFRTHVSTLINQVHNTKRPIVITQHGKSSAVLLAVSEYEKMVDTFEMIKEIETANRQIDEGRGISHSEAHNRLKGRMKA